MKGWEDAEVSKVESEIYLVIYLYYVQSSTKNHFVPTYILLGLINSFIPQGSKSLEPETRIVGNYKRWRKLDPRSSLARMTSPAKNFSSFRFRVCIFFSFAYGDSVLIPQTIWESNTIELKDSDRSSKILMRTRPKFKKLYFFFQIFLSLSFSLFLLFSSLYNSRESRWISTITHR